MATLSILRLISPKHGDPPLGLLLSHNRACRSRIHGKRSTPHHNAPPLTSTTPRQHWAVLWSVPHASSDLKSGLSWTRLSWILA
eukprot:398254-Rhodomonas_salina.2